MDARFFNLFLLISNNVNRFNDLIPEDSKAASVILLSANDKRRTLLYSFNLIVAKLYELKSNCFSFFGSESMPTTRRETTLNRNSFFSLVFLIPLPQLVNISSTDISFQSKNCKQHSGRFKVGNNALSTFLRYVEPGRAFVCSSISSSSASSPI